MASTYSLLDHDAEDTRIENPDGPTLANQISAAVFVTSLFNAKDIPSAYMGGFAMRVRGSDRSTQDVDMVVQASMRAMWDVITPEKRLIIPNTRLIEGVIRIFVRTGPGWDGCAEYHEVELDIIQGGAKGTPKALLAAREQLSFPPSFVAFLPPDSPSTIWVLSLEYMLKTKLRACANRSMDRDYYDLKCLFRTQRERIEGLRDKLDPDEVEAFLQGCSESEKEDVLSALGHGWVRGVWERDEEDGEDGSGN